MDLALGEGQHSRMDADAKALKISVVVVEPFLRSRKAKKEIREKSQKEGFPPALLFHRHAFGKC